ncbi:transcription-repair coupling factor [Deferribacterales bacterium RsTz2092]|nr:transcription-repair-coupling factor [Deferribacterales bacterium]
MTSYSGLFGAARAGQILKLKKASEAALVIADDAKQAELYLSELMLFADENTQLLIFPEYTHEPFDELRVLDEIASARANALHSLLTNPCSIVITTPYALLKKIAPVDAFRDSIIELKTGTIFARQDLLNALDRLGYLPVELVNGHGEFCTRGGIVDIFPLGAATPVRIEYYGDELETIFSYEVAMQKKLDELNSVVLLPVSEILFSTNELLELGLDSAIHEKIENFGKYAGHHWLVPAVYDEPATLFDYMPDCPLVVLPPTPTKELFDNVLKRIDETHKTGNENTAFITTAEAENRISTNAVIFTDVPLGGDGIDNIACPYQSVKPHFAFEKKNFYQSLSSAMNEFKRMHESGLRTVAAVESRRFIKLIRDYCRDYELAVIEISNISELREPKALYLYTKSISGGFISEKEKIVCASDDDIFGFVRRRNKPKRAGFDTKISELEAGDYIVHVDYGIGVYKGLKHQQIDDVEGDYLEITYENDSTLYVPLAQISQLQKYIGVSDAKPHLSSLQSAAWAKTKASARKNAAKIAQDLLKLYAERKVQKGFRFIAGGAELDEFERRFPYDETDDQFAAVLDVYKDMEDEMPMDRLICGDVGFGKTEVAMRATYKAVLSGKQVAVLVPTTVLARQHYITFLERFRGTAVEIEFVSRFRTTAELRKVREKLASGAVDVIIGTHRLLSNDIMFKNLGLLVIDEEQRFGVAHKEKISALRANVDVLAMSATPIPRTLQLSLSGIRNISTIETPPTNRLPVGIKVIRTEDEIQSAILWELERGGQVFFLHNRILDIANVVNIVQRTVPLARVAVAHGQTAAKELEDILRRFYNGDIDVLVSTTIIENGIDIPNVNAIIIDDAAHFGLSQLYQLKGRVGRSGRRGHCYLLVRDFATLSPTAKKRLAIIGQLSDLGSGLKIAMSDLQLRGAGDILGAQQSGFAIKIGYELFLQMIYEAVSALQEADGITSDTEIITQYPHYIAADYIDDAKTRLDYYRAFAGIKDASQMTALFDELKMLYGELRKETTNLGYIMLIKNTAGALGITKAVLYPQQINFALTQKSRIEPQKLMSVAEKLKLKFRFIGEYEFLLALPAGEDTLTTTVQFIEQLNDK